DPRRPFFCHQAFVRNTGWQKNGPRVPPILVSAASPASGQQIQSESPAHPEGSGHLGLGLSPSNRVPAAGGPPGTPQMIGGAGDGFGPRAAIALGRGSSSSRARFSRKNYNNVTLLRRKSLEAKFLLVGGEGGG